MAMMIISILEIITMEISLLKPGLDLLTGQLDDGSGYTDATTGVIFSSPGFEITMDNLLRNCKKWQMVSYCCCKTVNFGLMAVSSGYITVNGSGINNTSIGARYDAKQKLLQIISLAGSMN